MFNVKSHFLRHEACENCGSKDNVGVYSGGTSYCFGCGSFKRLPRSESGAFHESNLYEMGTIRSEKQKGQVRSYPDDANYHFPHTVIEWIKKYHLTAADLIKNHVYWSPSREQLLYTFFGDGKDVVLWQARNFKSGTTHKRRFFTGGSPENIIATYHQGEERSTKCCIVEDCVSGIKVSYSGIDGIPCFGSTLSREKLTRLAQFYDKLYVWLDSDKYSNSQKICQQAASLGLQSRVIYTELDPKEYSVEDIKEKLCL